MTSFGPNIDAFLVELSEVGVPFEFGIDGASIRSLVDTEGLVCPICAVANQRLGLDRWGLSVSGAKWDAQLQITLAECLVIASAADSGEDTPLRRALVQACGLA